MRKNILNLNSTGNKGAYICKSILSDIGNIIGSKIS